VTDQEYYAKAYIKILIFPDQFREEFADWLWNNLQLQREFDQEALIVVAKGRTRYSAHTIIEYMRHYTMLADSGGEFKVNEAWTSSMARLFAHMYPAHHDLLEFRVRRGAVVGPLVL
jgi:hypothetical protein